MKKKELLSFWSYLTTLSYHRVTISKEFVDWLKKTKSIEEIEALAILDDNFEKIKSIIAADIKLHKSKYTYSKFQFSQYDSDILIQTQFHYEPDLKYIISNKIEWWKPLSELIKLLNWREFEFLVKRIMSSNDLTDVKITEATNDNGIDFFGYYAYKESGNLKRLAKDLRFRVVGQVKHSASGNGVDHQKIASFGTEIFKLRKTNNSTYFRHLDLPFLTSPLPIIGIFVTNSYYPIKAVDFAEEYGIVFWDDVQISQDLATPLLINQIRDENGHLSKELFIKVINES